VFTISIAPLTIHSNPHITPFTIHLIIQATSENIAVNHSAIFVLPSAVKNKNKKSTIAIIFFLTDSRIVVNIDLAVFQSPENTRRNGSVKAVRIVCIDNRTFEKYKTIASKIIVNQRLIPSQKNCRVLEKN